MLLQPRGCHIEIESQRLGFLKVKTSLWESILKLWWTTLHVAIIMSGSLISSNLFFFFFFWVISIYQSLSQWTFLLFDSSHSYNSYLSYSEHSPLSLLSHSYNNLSTFTSKMSGKSVDFLVYLLVLVYIVLGYICLSWLLLFDFDISLLFLFCAIWSNIINL